MSIIAATAFHFRVRNGNGCFHSAKSPEQKIQFNQGAKKLLLMQIFQRFVVSL